MIDRGAVRTFATPDELAAGAATWIAELATTTLRTRARFSVALAGGSTPRATYRLLANDPIARSVAWDRVHVFWGDERCVPPTDEQSNYRMAHDAFLSRVPIPKANVHRIEGELEPRVAATRCERRLRDILGESAVLDLVVLGLGEDGHTASLFPDSEAVRTDLARSQQRFVVANYIERLRAWRITLTPWAINAAANVLFLVAGAHKAQTLARVLTGSNLPGTLPAQLIRPATGRLLWMVDDAAARGLVVV